MQCWLHAKAEEDRRKQVEEKTRQEGFRLDQRRIEQTMLRESLQGGIPPPMIPLLFAGIGGGDLPAHILEWAQQYLATQSIQNQQQQQQQQIQAQQQQIQQQQQQQMSPDLHGDSRMILPTPYGGHRQPPEQTQSPVSSQQTQPASLGRSSISGPQSASPALSRLNTTEFVLSSTTNSATRQPLHRLQQTTQTASSEPSSGPGLLFHHWTPLHPSSGASIQ
jgi:hypothetical protein